LRLIRRQAKLNEVAVKIIALSACLLLLSATAPQAGDTPFAAPSAPHPGEPAANSFSLADIMVQTQVRHIKLWYAGQSGDWALVGYEIDRITDTLTRAAILYAGIPIELVTRASEPIGEMRKAAAAKDVRAFRQGYADLTKACNACHEAGGVGFIKIQTPTSLPFTDESFGK
jgi:hypothetical protein